MLPETELMLSNDWLGSNKVYYNLVTQKISGSLYDVIDWANFEWSAEGLANYLECGFSFLGQTPINNVKYLRANERIEHTPTGISVQQMEDPYFSKMGRGVSEQDVWALTEASVRQWEDNATGELVIPTSGGYDSRILNYFVKDKSRIRSYSYGGSENQGDNYNVKYAKKLSEIFHTHWKHIELGDFHKYLPDWYQLYGPLTHAHGMHQFEFYNKIKLDAPNAKELLSGLIGDAWAGSVNIKPINAPSDVFNLSYSHGMKVDSKYCKLHHTGNLVEEYYETNKQHFTDSRFLVTESMRTKIVLLNYLLNVPKALGFKPFAPWIDPELCLSMLFMPDERRKGRVWQTEFFAKHGLAIEKMGIEATSQNSLYHQAILRVPLSPLSNTILGEIIKPELVHFVNSNVEMNLKNRLRHQLRIKMAATRFVRRFTPPNIENQAYNSYLVLYPLQQLIIERDKRNK
jgi:hypothetical protein